MGINLLVVGLILMLFPVWIVATVDSWIGDQEKEIVNPYANDSEEIAQGATYFRLDCAFCHGIGAQGGGRGPNLTLGRWEHGGTDAALFRTIERGVPGTEMPPSVHTNKRIWRLISFLRSVGAASQAPVTGDRESGKNIFLTKGNCSRCHMINGKGGRLGPDLSSIGTSRSAASLADSIRDPVKEIPKGYKTITVVTVDGKRITGVRKNEDTFSIQLMSPNEKLYLFFKRDLKEIIYQSNSLMPSYGPEMLLQEELEDLLSYLDALRGK